MSSSSCSHQDWLRLPSAPSHCLGLLSAPTTLIERPMSPWEEWGWITRGISTPWDWKFLRVQKRGWRVTQVQKQNVEVSSGPSHHADLHQVVLICRLRTSRGSDKGEHSWINLSFRLPDTFKIWYLKNHTKNSPPQICSCIHRGLHRRWEWWEIEMESTSFLKKSKLKIPHHATDSWIQQCWYLEAWVKN